MYLAIGAAGFVGRSIATELLRREKVRRIDNLSAGKRENLTDLGAMEFIRADLTVEWYRESKEFV